MDWNDWLEQAAEIDRRNARLAQLEALARDLASCNGIHPDEYSVQTIKLVRRALELTGGAR